MPEGEATEAIPPVRRRKPRIAADEARRRVLDAGVRHALEGGLTVGFRHLPLERYIEEAEVSRASAYRQWGRPGGRGAHEDFVADLVQTLFDHPRFANGFSPATTSALTQGLQSNLPMLETAEGRRRLFRDLIRIAAEQNFRDLIGSSEWRSYEVLYVAAANSADAEASPEMRATARLVEQRFLASMAGFFQSIVGMLRMRPREGYSFQTIALATHVTVSGIAHRIDVAPELADLYVDGPALDGGTTRWHFAALLTMHAVDALLEDVPDGEAAPVEA